jgi:hypothetical protein
MTNFQLVALGVFGLSVLVAYSQEILAVIRRAANVVRGLFTFSTKKPTGALGPKERVNDLVTVAELRDRLAAANCATGVEACTMLLRAMVDHPSCCKN